MTKRKKPASPCDKIQVLQDQLGEAEAGWQRAVADYQNLEKRQAKDREEIVKLANTVLINKFLGVLDDLERAKEHCQDQGLDLVINQFRAVLSSEGVEEIKVEAEVFDPHRMECVATVADQDQEPERVVKVTKKGYLYKDGQGYEQILRPAGVIVNRATPDISKSGDL